MVIAVGLFIGGFYSYIYIADQGFSASPVKFPTITEETLPEKTEYLPQHTDKIIYHKYYTLSFNSHHKQANWVYYCPRIGKGESKVERKDCFQEDQMVPAGCAKPSDYTNSGYDRGHLCPAGDMTQSAEAMDETFYMSNISPQVPGFNRGIWKSLEKQVREWGEREQIYVVTGPVFREKKGSIGKSEVTVPGHYYKVIYAPGREQMIAFILPNEKSKKKFTDYIVSVDSVENFTGIDFFPQLPDTLENRLEACSDYGKWHY